MVPPPLGPALMVGLLRHLAHYLMLFGLRLVPWKRTCEELFGSKQTRIRFGRTPIDESCELRTGGFVWKDSCCGIPRRSLFGEDAMTAVEVAGVGPKPIRLLMKRMWRRPIVANGTRGIKTGTHLALPALGSLRWIQQVDSNVFKLVLWPPQRMSMELDETALFHLETHDGDFGRPRGAPCIADCNSELVEPHDAKKEILE